MEIFFNNIKLKETCESEGALKKKYGKECARKIRIRLDDLMAATSLEDFRNGLTGRCHELKGDRKYQLSLDLKHPLRLVFKPKNFEKCLRVDGSLDWKKVDAIEVIGVEDTHD